MKLFISITHLSHFHLTVNKFIISLTHTHTQIMIVLQITDRFSMYAKTTYRINTYRKLAGN